MAKILQDVESEEMLALKEYLKLSKKKEKEKFIKECSKVDWSTMETAQDGTYSKAVVNGRIKALQLEYEFDEDSLEGKLVQALKLMEEESKTKKDIKTKAEELHLKTKTTIEELDEDTSLYLVELKWIKPLTDALCQMPVDVIADFSNQIIHLVEKYEVTFADVEAKIECAGSALVKMIDDLVGSDADMEGLAEFKRILGGNANE